MDRSSEALPIPTTHSTVNGDANHGNAISTTANTMLTKAPCLADSLTVLMMLWA